MTAECLHDKRYPDESDEYRDARNELLRAESDLRARIEQVAAMRRKLPPGGALKEDYVFEEIELGTGRIQETRLSDLFDGGLNTLAVYSYMYGPGWDAPCPLCTALADGFGGLARHVTPRTGFAMVSKAPVARLADWAGQRGWRGFRLLSAFKNDYQRDYLAQTGDDPDKQWPMLNVFVRRDGDIRHFWGSELFYCPPATEGQHPRHLDLLWPMWNLFDLTPEGRGDWLPKLEY